MIQLNRGQEDIVSKAIDWYKNSSEQVFQIAGNPGTGKSVVLNEIISRLKLKIEDVAPMAYTGAASVVMRMKGLLNAKTIHSWLYEAVEEEVLDKYGKPVLDPYFNKPMVRKKFIPKDLSNIKLIVIDEAGSVPLHMKKHILGTKCKILVAGDLDQLPPVADNPAFLYTGYVHVLTEIMRQAEGSPIIYLSQRAKKGLPIHLGNYGSVWVIPEDEMQDWMLASAPVILCGRNATRENLINHIRHDIMGNYNSVPCHGETVICRKNNWNVEEGGINLTNGLTGTVINHPDVRNFDGKTFRLSFVPSIARDIVFKKLRCSYDYLIANYEQKRMIKSNLSNYFTGDLFEFGYALTVHLSQGSQWTHGVYFEEYMNPQMNNALNYTALTRFSDKCIYVKPKRKYR